MGFLEFDFQKANAQIEELEQIAADLEKLVSSRYEESMQQLGGAWKGAGAEAYMRKASRLQEKMERSSGDVRSTAEVFRNVTRQVRLAEELAAQIAAERES